MARYAIVGLSCLFPGASTPEEFWGNLLAGVDSRTDGGPAVLGERLGGEDPVHRITATRGGFVEGLTVDLEGFRIPAERLRRLDRGVHWALHACRAALADAGLPATGAGHTGAGAAGTDPTAAASGTGPGPAADALLARTGLVLGNYSFPTPASARLCLPMVRAGVAEGLRRTGVPVTAPDGPDRGDAAAGTDPVNLEAGGLPARAIATALGLGGPRYALDAACASALYALRLACDHLATGQADLMLAGGLCAPDPVLIHLCFSDLHAYPGNGVSQPFDARSAGIVTGQGAGIVAVKRLADAISAGDRVLAVIEGIGLSNDGSGRHLLIPDAGGQRDAYQRAYADGSPAPTDVSYVECHATGTPVGDRTELESVAAFFGGRSTPVPLLGSVKANIGHLLTVAGLSSMAKVVLAMRHGVIPPTIGVGAPVSSRDGAAGGERLVRAATAWPQPAGSRRGAVSAFGFGGTNAHVVLSDTVDSAGPAVRPTPVPVLDVVGIGCTVGPLTDVAALERGGYDGVRAMVPLPAHRWRGVEALADTAAAEPQPTGAFLATVDIVPMDYRIPPSDLRNTNPQQLLMLRVADEALHDAGYRRHSQPAGDSGGAGPERAREPAGRAGSDDESAARGTRAADSGGAGPEPGRPVPEPRRIAVVIAMEMEPAGHLHLARHGAATLLPDAASLPPDRWSALAQAVRDGVHDPIVANEVLSYIGSVMASRISSLWNLTGPSFTISSDGAAGLEALEAARLLLLDDAVEAVLVGSVDLAGGPECVLLNPDRPADGAAVGPLGGAGAEPGWPPGDGAAAVVVTRVAGVPDAPRRYARIDAVAIRHATGTGLGATAPDGAGGAGCSEAAGADPTGADRSGAQTAGAGAATPGAGAAGAHPVVAAVRDAAIEALARAGVDAASVGFLEAHAGGAPGHAGAELAGLAAAYRAAGDAGPAGTAGDARAPGPAGDVQAAGTTGGGDRSCALGSVVTQCGDTKTASVMVGIVRAVLCLHHRYLPAVPGWIAPAPALADTLAGTRFYVPTQSRPWLPPAGDGRRRAAVSVASRSGACGSVLLSGYPADRPAGPGAWTGPLVLPLGATDPAGLLAELERHRTLLSAGEAGRPNIGGEAGKPDTAGPDAAAAELVAAALRGPLSGPARVVLVATEAAGLQRELDQAARDLPAMFAAGGEWTTPAGSYATARPIGPDAPVALVFPGAFSAYPEAGRDLFRAFPRLLYDLESAPDGQSAAATFADPLLFPRGLAAPARRDLMLLEADLVEDVPAMLGAGTTFANLYTDLLRDVLGLPVGGAFGYSLGESSMLFALGRWDRAARTGEAIRSTPLFRDRLCGRRRTVRELWELPDSRPDDRIWATHLLLADADTVGAALPRFPRVFLTHVNTPAEVVVSGDPDGCRALIAELGCRSARAPANHVMHCPAVAGEAVALATLNRYPLGAPAGPVLLSAYDYGPVPDCDSATLADRIAATLSATVDFPRLVRAAYDRGFRYFVEVGPGATCTRWVRETLADRPHVAASADRRGASAPTAVAQLAARLVAHGLRLDLTALAGTPPPPAPPASGLHRVVVGGEPIADRVEARVRAVMVGSAPIAGADGTAAGPTTPANGSGAGPTTPANGSAAGPTARPASAPAPLAIGGNIVSIAVRAAAEPAATALDWPAAPDRLDVLAFDEDPVAAPGGMNEPAGGSSERPADVGAVSAAGHVVPFSGVPGGPSAAEAVPARDRPAVVPSRRAGAATSAELLATAGLAPSAGGAADPDRRGAIAAGLVGDLRRQLTAAHAAVIAGQSALQSRLLEAIESLPAAAPHGAAPSRPTPAWAPVAPPVPAAPPPPSTLLIAGPPLAAPRVPAAPPPPSTPLIAGPPLAAAPPTAMPRPMAPPPAPPARPLATPPARPLVRSPVAPAAPALTAPPDGVIWDENDLLTFATGRLADVFGPAFAAVDGYRRRVRLPAPPYHFVTRVTALSAEPGRFEPSFIRTEYDVPIGAWYCVDGGVPPAVAIEAGQCDLLLISYLGIDLETRGERVYRLLDSTLVFHGDLPREGQTLRYDISINRFVRGAGPTLFFFSYDCYADGELILQLTDACAGFFTDEELTSPLGVVGNERERQERANLTQGMFKPLARSNRSSLTAADLALLAEGEIGAVFGPEHAMDPGLNPALRLPTGQLRMVDEIDHIDPTGGPRGLGRLTAVKHLQPDAWYFTSHFPDDPVLAGSLVAEGAVQILQAYLLHRGMHLMLPDARFQTVIGLSTEVKVRGQIRPEHDAIRFEVEIMELTLLPRPRVVADILVYLGAKPVVRMRNFGVEVREKPGTPYRPEAGGTPAFLGRRNRDGEPAMINELHLAHAAKGDLATAMGPEFEVYRESRAPYIPNGDFQFVDRIMRLGGTRGELTAGSTMVTEYDSPADAWYYRDGPTPAMPMCVYMETSLQAAILLGYYLGATLRQPATVYSIRNLDGQATILADVDLRGKTISHHSRLLSSDATPGAVLQNFGYELFADGAAFYRGESLFGFFTVDALANQVGLDAGRFQRPWLDEQDIPPSALRRVGLEPGSGPRTGAGGGLLHLAGGHLSLVDEVEIVPAGGRFGAGYLRGRQHIDPAAWYFSCHFHRDPVMPGSLGVEAVLQGLQAFVLDQQLAEGIPNPRFALPAGQQLSWRYRGQILRDDGDMQFDVHVREIQRDGDRLVVVGDASLWKPDLRIYELTGVAIEVSPSDLDFEGSPA